MWIKIKLPAIRNRAMCCIPAKKIDFVSLASFILVTFHIPCFSQDSIKTKPDTLDFSGQLVIWADYNGGNRLPLRTAVRYIPTLYMGTRSAAGKTFDFEGSANINGSIAFNPFDTSHFEGNLKPYRFWVRYSTRQLELRLGLQKINFGSASILRPLMWFDKMDPRDPLHLTDGVWGLLGRYYFLNNANIWLWGLYGNQAPGAWEIIPSNKRIPEFGGRIQIPVPGGEAAFSYNHRNADNRGMAIPPDQKNKIPEDKFGIDARWDLVTGLWIEGSWTRKGTDLGTLTNLEVMNAGIDYTFGIGNGLYAAYEHLLMSYDRKAFSFLNKTSFSLLLLSYPIGLFDKLSAIVYYDWTNKRVYNFATWQKQFDNISIYFMGYWNPVGYKFPALTGTQNYYSGKGIQVMLVFNH